MTRAAAAQIKSCSRLCSALQLEYSNPNFRCNAVARRYSLLGTSLTSKRSLLQHHLHYLAAVIARHPKSNGAVRRVALNSYLPHGSFAVNHVDQVVAPVGGVAGAGLQHHAVKLSVSRHRYPRLARRRRSRTRTDNRFTSLPLAFLRSALDGRWEGRGR